MSFSPARPVDSPQTGCHPSLDIVVGKHLRNHFRKPIPAHTQRAFDHAHTQWRQNGCFPIILDSGCGCGRSSRVLAKQYREYFVIGLDRSQRRLNHSANGQLPDNCLLLHCDCSDFWRLAARAQWRIAKHYLLYPNPYPKSEHLKRRWHGHPALYALLVISQRLELRTNWEIYAQEFMQALIFAGWTAKLQRINPPRAITAFEDKYQHSGHVLWRVLANAALDLKKAVAPTADT